MPVKFHNDFWGVDFWCAICCPYCIASRGLVLWGHACGWRAPAACCHTPMSYIEIQNTLKLIVWTEIQNTKYTQKQYYNWNTKYTQKLKVVLTESACVCLHAACLTRHLPPNTFTFHLSVCVCVCCPILCLFACCELDTSSAALSLGQCVMGV